MWQSVQICNLTCFDQLFHSIAYITVAINIGWHLSAVVESGEAHLFLDQSETQRVEKIFFETAPPPPHPLSEGLDLPLISISMRRRAKKCEVTKTEIFNGLDRFAPTGWFLASEHFFKFLFLDMLTNPQISQI